MGPTIHHMMPTRVQILFCVDPVENMCVGPNPTLGAVWSVSFLVPPEPLIGLFLYRHLLSI